jgi:flagellar protein FliS
MRHYHQAALESANGVQLVVALYDGMQRFLMQAASACEAEDIPARREAARRTLNIILYLQSNLRMDVGGEPAQRLSDFYTAIFADILRASASASAALFLSTARQIRSVREAWKVAAQDPAVLGIMPRDLRIAPETRTAAEARAFPEARADQEGRTMPGTRTVPIREPHVPESSPAWIA